jgi:4-hydroxybenzoate polyprenyltransferase
MRTDDGTLPATSDRMRLSSYVQIARPDHWIKNIFVLPGTAAAVALGLRVEAPGLVLLHLLAGLVSVCLLASANYTINEYLDAAFDRFHPRVGPASGACAIRDAVGGGTADRSRNRAPVPALRRLAAGDGRDL